MDVECACYICKCAVESFGVGHDEDVVSAVPGFHGLYIHTHACPRHRVLWGLTFTVEDPGDGSLVLHHQFKGEDEPELRYYCIDDTWALSDGSGYDTTDFKVRNNERLFLRWLQARLGKE